MISGDDIMQVRKSTYRMEVKIPNWTPSEDHIRRLQQAVEQLTNRRATMMEAEYPLTFEQVVDITTPPRLAEFARLGYDSLQKTHHIAYELGPDQGLHRRSVTQVVLPRPIQYAFERQTQSNYNEQKPQYFNREGIDDETMARLVKWTNEAVYERRLAKLCNKTVAVFFQHMAAAPDGSPKLTMYHIMARWPGLKVVFPRTTGNWRGGDMWERHGNETPKNLQRWSWPKYGPEAEWYATNQRRLELVEETLLSCVSLKNVDGDGRQHWNQPRTLTAKITDWQVIGDAPT